MLEQAGASGRHRCSCSSEPGSARTAVQSDPRGHRAGCAHSEVIGPQNTTSGGALKRSTKSDPDVLAGLLHLICARAASDPTGALGLDELVHLQRLDLEMYQRTVKCILAARAGGLVTLDSFLVRPDGWHHARSIISHVLGIDGPKLQQGEGGVFGKLFANAYFQIHADHCKKGLWSYSAMGKDLSFEGGLRHVSVLLSTWLEVREELLPQLRQARIATGTSHDIDLFLSVFDNHIPTVILYLAAIRTGSPVIVEIMSAEIVRTSTMVHCTQYAGAALLDFFNMERLKKEHKPMWQWLMANANTLATDLAHEHVNGMLAVLALARRLRSLRDAPAITGLANDLSTIDEAGELECRQYKTLHDRQKREWKGASEVTRSPAELAAYHATSAMLRSVVQGLIDDANAGNLAQLGGKSDDVITSPRYGQYSARLLVPLWSEADADALIIATDKTWNELRSRPSVACHSIPPEHVGGKSDLMQCGLGGAPPCDCPSVCQALNAGYAMRDGHALSGRPNEPYTSAHAQVVHAALAHRHKRLAPGVWTGSLALPVDEKPWAQKDVTVEGMRKLLHPLLVEDSVNDQKFWKLRDTSEYKTAVRAQIEVLLTHAGGLPRGSIFRGDGTSPFDELIVAYGLQSYFGPTQHKREMAILADAMTCKFVLPPPGHALPLELWGAPHLPFKRAFLAVAEGATNDTRRRGDDDDTALSDVARTALDRRRHAEQRAGPGSVARRIMSFCPRNWFEAVGTPALQLTQADECIHILRAFEANGRTPLPELGGFDMEALSKTARRLHAEHPELLLRENFGHLQDRAREIDGDDDDSDTGSEDPEPTAAGSGGSAAGVDGDGDDDGDGASDDGADWRVGDA